MPERRSGGSEQRRGAAFQDYSLLFYILSRLSAYPDLEIEVESVEDATIIYRSNDSETVTTEYVQCKKHEQKDDGQVHAGVNSRDRWAKGMFYVRELEDWLVTEREGLITANLLNSNPDAFYTALIFGYFHAKLEPFIPAGLRDLLPILYPPPDFNEKFPVAYSHAGKSLKLHNKNSQKIITAESLNRVRVISTGSPKELETMCWRMLTTPDLFGVSRHKADGVLNDLLKLIVEASQIQGNIKGRQIAEIISAGRMEQGLWQGAAEVLEKGVERQADINRGDPLRWYDFENKNFAYYEELGLAFDAVKDRGALVVISGSVGSGKSTLCKYLMYQFLSGAPQRRAYYLSALAGIELTDEIDFLEQNIQTDALFIVDDEHLAEAEVFSLIQKFWGYKTSGNAEARLVISSKTNYGRAGALGEGHNTNLLRNAIQINLPLNSRETVEHLLSQIKQRTNLETPLSNREIADLSDGVLGVALLITRCVRSLSGNSTLEDILTAQNLKSKIARWILSYLPDLKETRDFEDKVVPLFVISAFGLPIPEEYSPSIIPALSRAGFLEPYGFEESYHLYRAADINLAFMLQAQYKHAYFDILQEYISRYPQWLPQTLTRVGEWKESQRTLQQLTDAKRELIVGYISALACPPTLTDRMKVLQAIRSSARRTSTRIFQRWASPSNQANDYFFIDAVAMARSARELTGFLRLIERIDKELQILPEMAAAQLMQDESRKILSLLKDDACRLDDAAACIHALRLYYKIFADQLYKDFTASAEFQAKVTESAAAGDGLSVLLRFCEEVKRFDREESYRWLGLFLSPERIIQATLAHASGINTLSVFLLHLHRLQPRLAADLVSDLWLNHQGQIETLFRREKYLDTLTQDFYAFSRINKIVTIQIANEVFDRLVFLFRNENKSSIISSTIESVWKHTSRNLARRLCQAMDKDKVLDLVRAEKRYVDKVGRFLFFLSRASDATAAWFEERLDYQYFLRVARIPRLRDIVILIRGFQVAVSFQRVNQLKQKMLADATLIRVFKSRWERAEHLSDIGFCLTALMDSNLSKSEMRRLLGFNNLSEFIEDIERRFASSDSILHITNGLYGVAQYNPFLARKVLRQYVERVDRQGSNGTADRARTGQVARSEQQADEFIDNKNIVELGCLLQIASAINSTDARRLLKRKFAADNPGRSVRADERKRPEVIETAIKESHSGRLTVFLTGLQQSSRHYSLIVIDGISKESQWQKIVEENEELENLIHFIRALNRASAARSAAFVKFLFKNYALEITQSLRYEVNTLLIANWLRVLAQAGADFIQAYAPPLIASLKEAVKYDSHLWHLLESAQTLLELEAYQEAREVCEHILAEAPLMHTVRNLNDWLVLMNKAIYIEQKGSVNNFTLELTRYMDDAQFSILLAPRGQEVLSGFAYHLFKVTRIPSLAPLRARVLAEQPTIVQAAIESPDSTVKLIALILSEAPADAIYETAEKIEWLEANAWTLGLAALLFNAIYAEQERTFPVLVDTQSETFKEFLLNDVSKHSTNLEFALTLYLANYLRFDEETLSRLKEQATKRAEDESLAAIRWLLKNYENVSALKGLPYYIWSYLQSTILRPLYLPWANDIEQIVKDSFTFRRSQRNLSELSQTSALDM
ncbi:MAG TPA: hypothetical protein VGV59_15295 [Pyrinomonadaceae bacterium]|nr:hypothetical protein [Pyrinomonadaceae bacterium]